VDTERTPEPPRKEPDEEGPDFARGQHELDEEAPEEHEGSDFARGQHELDEAPEEREDPAR
jgi:hypothetical protein